LAQLTHEELDVLARDVDERMESAIAEGPEALATYSAIEEMWRAFVGILDDWASLTRSYIAGRREPLGDVRELRPEHIAELAVRRGATLDQLHLAAAMLDGPANPAAEQIGAAVEAGDEASAWAAWAAAREVMALVRALRCDQINDVLGGVHRRYGEEGLRAAMIYAADHGFWRDGLPSQLQVAPEALLADTAFFLIAGAGCRLRLDEEEDRFVIEFTECHCGRQIAEHRKGAWDLPVVDGPTATTYGVAAMTPYQTHLAVIHGTWAIDATGQPIPPFDCVGAVRGQDAVPACRSYIYKTAVPRRYFEALGRADAYSDDA
jgi:hypothetical protein